MNKFVIDRGILLSNIERIHGLIGKKKLCVMVKADAYGHGLVRISKIVQGSVDYLGVACISEGIRLRNNNIYAPILVVGSYDRRLAKLGIVNDLTLSIGSEDSMLHLSKLVSTLRIKTKVHIQVNSGMNRYGLDCRKDLNKILQIASCNPYVIVEGIFSHISNACDKLSTFKQYNKFKNICKHIPKNTIRHIASSEVVSRYKNMHMDMVRVGIAMYGYGLGCRPILTITSNIVDIRYVKKGATIGYNNKYCLQRDSFVGTVAIGYADGINRKLSQGGKVAVDGKCYKIAGNVCMDCFMVDFGSYRPHIGQEVIILDSDINAEVIASQCDTICYEILTSYKTNRMKVLVKA